ncbi:MAG: formate dehydrogenase, partial [Chloroflexi bacterium]|nr:formate dehydrogenase [Chloroflexota bacterium]
GAHAGWAFSWPANRRLLYNRASADPQGQPWSERKRYVWWDEAQARWVGLDAPDFDSAKPPTYVPPPDATGVAAHAGYEPFIMKAEGRACLFVPAGVKDGPLPTHYEPVESPVRNPLYAEQHSPVAELFRRRENPLHAPADPRYPYVITTYRLTEQHAGGLMSRAVPWLAELQPEGFVEIGVELAREKGIAGGDWVTVSTARGEVAVRALVTDRLRALEIAGQRVHQVGLPWHFGYRGYARGAVANDLTALVGDPTVTIHEGKAFTCDIRPGRPA